MFQAPEFFYALDLISEEIESRGLCAVWLESIAALFGVGLTDLRSLATEAVSTFASTGGLGAKAYVEEKVVVFYRGDAPDETVLYLEALTKGCR